MENIDRKIRYIDNKLNHQKACIFVPIRKNQILHWVRPRYYVCSSDDFRLLNCGFCFFVRAQMLEQRSKYRCSEHYFLRKQHGCYISFVLSDRVIHVFSGTEIRHHISVPCPKCDEFLDRLAEHELT